MDGDANGTLDLEMANTALVDPQPHALCVVSVVVVVVVIFYFLLALFLFFLTRHILLALFKLSYLCYSTAGQKPFLALCEY